MKTLKVAKKKEKTHNSNGERLRSSDGEPYTFIKIKAEDPETGEKMFGGRTLTAFKGGTTAQIQEGTVINTNIEVVERNGSEYLNFDAKRETEIVGGGKEPTTKRATTESNNMALQKVLKRQAALGNKLKEIQNTVEAIYESDVEQPADKVPENPYEEEDEHISNLEW